MELGTQRNKENFILTLIRLGFLKIVSLGGGRGWGVGQFGPTLHISRRTNLTNISITL